MQFINGRYVLAPDYLRQPAAWFHTRILVGPGAFLTQRFAAEMGITHVINCAFPGDSPEWFQDRFPEQYTCLYAIDSPYVNILEWYPAFEAAMHRFLRQGTGVVYVHCQAGMNRSGFLALTYVSSNFDIPLDALVEATKRQRSVLLQNSVFMNQVREFINGRVSSAKNQRLDVDRVHDGDAGLSSSDDRPGSEGVVHDAGESPDRTGSPSDDDLGTPCEE